MIRFEKVSETQFVFDCKKRWHTDAAEAYACLKRPKRATAGSAGYDFFAPFDFTLAPKEALTIPTGMRAVMPQGVVLIIAPRSGQGMRYKLQLMNTVGVIDSDYQFADNEGHIMIAIYNDSPEGKVLEVRCGQAFAQGVFLPYLLCDDDAAKAERHGGFGSTDTNNA